MDYDYDSESAMSQAFLANLASGVLLHASIPAFANQRCWFDGGMDESG